MGVGFIFKEIIKAVAVSAGAEVMQKKVIPAVQKKIKDLREASEDEQEPEEVVDVEEMPTKSGKKTKYKVKFK